MPKTSYHDVIVIGTDLAGLMAAGLLQRKRYRVLLVGQGGLKDHYEHEGQPLPALPTTLPAFGEAPVLDELLHDLAVEDPVHRLGTGVDTHLQVITPSQRLDLFQTPDALRAELKRAVPDQSERFLKAVEGLRPIAEPFRKLVGQRPPLPPEGLREKARLRRIEKASLAQSPLDTSNWPWLMEVLAQATTFFSHLDRHHRSPSATAHLTLSLLAGPRTVPDLAGRLVEADEKAGVDMEIHTVAEQVLLDGKNVTGIQALRNANTYQCGALVAALPLSAAVDLIPLKNRRQRARLTGDLVRPLTSVFVVNLLLPTQALPAGLGNHSLLVMRPNDVLEEDNLLRIQCLPFKGRKDRTQVCLSCLVPHRKRSLGREYLGPLQQRIMEAAGWLIPFLHQNLDAQTSPFWDSRAGDASHPSPWMLHRTIETDRAAVLGIAVLSTRTPLRNLLLCGPEIIPGLGLEGEALSALQTVRWIEQNKKLKKIL